MPTGPEMYSAVKAATADKPAGSEHWVTVNEKLDLCKLNAADLVTLHFNEQLAEAIEAALSHQDIGPLGDAMELNLRTKFRALAERDGGCSRIRCDGMPNAEWLQEYLRTRFPKSAITDPQPCDDSSLHCLTVTFDRDATPFALRQTLLECPAASMVRLYDVRVAEQPHYRLEAYNLAAWLEDQQEEEPWWTVDGDPLLMSRLEFPAPPDELAAELRKINKPLLAADPSGNTGGEELTAEEVERAMTSDEWDNRMLMLSWEGSQTDWQLIEDEPTSEGSSKYRITHTF